MLKYWSGMYTVYYIKWFHVVTVKQMNEKQQLTRRRPRCQSAVSGRVTLRGSSISTSSRGLFPPSRDWAQSAGICEGSWRLQNSTRHTGPDASGFHSAMCPSSTLFILSSLLFSDSESLLCCFLAISTFCALSKRIHMNCIQILEPVPVSFLSL